MTLEEFLARANNGYVSVNADLEVATGYDVPEPRANVTRPNWWYGDDEGPLLPKEFRVALADHMIALWQRYRNAVSD